MGHFARCLALAQCWRDEVGPVTFLGSLPELLRSRLLPEEIEFVDLSRAFPHPSDLQTLLSILPASSMVVVDGYHFDEDYLAGLRSGGHGVTFIDDNRHLDRYDVDILLNQNIHAHELGYGAESSVRLLGPEYALLRREFRRAARRPRVIPDVARNLLVTFGGADPENYTLEVLSAIREVAIEGLACRVVVGPLNAHRPLLEEFCALAGARFQLLDDPDMPEMLHWADLAISASGTSSMEVALMGLPSLMVAIAENQVAAGEALAARGVALWLGEKGEVAGSDLRDSLFELAHTRDQRERMTEAAQGWIDDKGPARVVEALVAHAVQR